MRGLKRKLVILISGFLLPLPVAYADTVPSAPVVQPGTTIERHNWQIAEHLLPPEILRLIEAGDFAITVQEGTDLPMRRDYLAATEVNLSRVRLDGGTATWVTPASERASQFIATNATFKDDDSPRRYELMELLRRGK